MKLKVKYHECNGFEELTVLKSMEHGIFTALLQPFLNNSTTTKIKATKSSKHHCNEVLSLAFVSHLWSLQNCFQSAILERNLLCLGLIIVPMIGFDSGANYSN